MPIVTFSEPLLQRLCATDRRILRDKIVCGFCLQLNKRSKTFLVATSVQGKQLRMTLGRWPLVSVEEARGLAIRLCENAARDGQRANQRGAGCCQSSRRRFGGYWPRQPQATYRTASRNCWRVPGSFNARPERFHCTGLDAQSDGGGIERAEHQSATWRAVVTGAGSARGSGLRISSAGRLKRRQAPVATQTPPVMATSKSPSRR